MRPTLSYQLRRLRSRLHRMRIALAVRGWRGLLARVFGPGPTDATESGAAPALPAAMPPQPQAAATRRWLLVDVTTPRPDRDSGSLRSWNLMRLLRAQGHQVDFLPDDGADAGHYTAALRALGVTVHAGAGSLARWFGRHLADYDVLVVSRYHLAESLLPLARATAPGVRVVLDTVDLHHLREQREAELRAHPGLLRLARTTRQRELAMVAAADMAWVVSPVEAALLREAIPGACVALLPNILEPLASPRGYAGRSGLLFVGGARHPPNVDAVEWLVREIFPLVRARLPDCELHLAGDGLAALAVAREGAPGVVVHDHVPDLAPLLGRCRFGLAPLRYGAGVKGKVNMYMAHGLPVVATPSAAEGTFLEHGRDVLLAADAAGLADAVVEASRDPALWQRLAANGLANVHEHFSFDTARRAVDGILETLR
ncbi:glycosyltransferase family 4 protein [Luteimonas composti]|uniref:Glycosyltransferase family 4 protein n=1 Tax=Luteimonas composti TaxID=398257 RepID=A0ABT6MSK6_9GAMM|nr:glycosyltransferase family 4 protein [Luteimonas composti]MDH7453606.1 glycosyltransferase family 4 protein [Luteimonas composti]